MEGCVCVDLGHKDILHQLNKEVDRIDFFMSDSGKLRRIYMTAHQWFQ